MPSLLFLFRLVLYLFSFVCGALLHRLCVPFCRRRVGGRLPWKLGHAAWRLRENTRLTLALELLPRVLSVSRASSLILEEERRRRSRLDSYERAERRDLLALFREASADIAFWERHWAERMLWATRPPPQRR